ncbi:hypothetical protein Q3G72_005227 [Acer saccharum]|nr:hypothetical protein Q3G72_005227 [Acer saccharum]
MHNPSDDDEVDSSRCRRQEIAQIKNKNTVCEPPLYDDNELVNVDVEISALPCTKRRKLVSNVWEDYVKDKAEDGKEFTVCKHCKMVVGSKNSRATKLKKHLEICQDRRNGDRLSETADVVEDDNEIRDWLESQGSLRFGGDLISISTLVHVLEDIVSVGKNLASDILQKIRKCFDYPRERSGRPLTPDSDMELLESAVRIKKTFLGLARLDPIFKSLTLTNKEWNKASALHECFQVLKDANCIFSGNKTLTANMYFLKLCEIRRKLDQLEKKSRWYVTKKASSMTYTLLDRYDYGWTSVLAIAAVLDPQFKMDILQLDIVQHWCGKLHDDVQGKLIMNNPYDDDGVDSSKCLGQKMSDAANSFEPTGNANRAETASETESALNDHAPLWKYVTKLEKMGKGGGNTSFQCNFCQQIYKGSYSRVKSHLLKIKGGGIASCSKVTNATLSEMHKVVEKAEFRVKQSLPRRVPLPTTSSSKTIGSSIDSTYYGLDLPSLGPKKRKGMSGPIEKAFNIGDKEQLDSEIARMFYTGGLSFNLARNPHYVRAFEIACSNSIPGYLPPDYNSLRTTLLQKEKTPIYEMLQMANNDTPCLHLVYEWWVSMIEKVKLAIFRKERKQLHEESKFFDVVHGILVEQWTESSTPLHCLAHSLNPRYYSNKWLKEAPGHVAPHQDFKIARERKKCLERYFSNEGERRSFNNEYAEFSLYLEDFSSGDSMMDRDFMAPATWWAVHGASTPTLQSIALKLLGQPCSSSSCERNWSTYNFIHSLRKNKITPQRGNCEDDFNSFTRSRIQAFLW